VAAPPSTPCFRPALFQARYRSPWPSAARKARCRRKALESSDSSDTTDGSLEIWNTVGPKARRPKGLCLLASTLAAYKTRNVRKVRTKTEGARSRLHEQGGKGRKGEKEGRNERAERLLRHRLRSACASLRWAKASGSEPRKESLLAPSAGLRAQRRHQEARWGYSRKGEWVLLRPQHAGFV